MARGRYGDEGGPAVPLEQWVTEVPFDSADYLDGAPPVYASGSTQSVVEAAVQEGLRDAAASRLRWRKWEREHPSEVVHHAKGIDRTPVGGSYRPSPSSSVEVEKGDAHSFQQSGVRPGTVRVFGGDRAQRYFGPDQYPQAARDALTRMAEESGMRAAFIDRHAAGQRPFGHRTVESEMATDVELAVQEGLRDTAASRARWIKWERLHGLEHPHLPNTTRQSDIEPHLGKLGVGSGTELPGGTRIVRTGASAFDVHTGASSPFQAGGRGQAAAHAAAAEAIAAKVRPNEHHGVAVGDKLTMGGASHTVMSVSPKGAVVKPDAGGPTGSITPERIAKALSKGPRAATPSAAPKIGGKVVINNGGTYEGKAVEVVRIEKDGSLIVKHPKGGSNMLRLKPGRTINGNAIEPQFRLREAEMDSVTEAVLAVLEGRSDCEGCGRVSEAADSMAKASTPEPFSSSRTSNWVARAGGLPAYVQHIAHDLMEKRGKSESNAIQMAIGIVKRWCAGGGKVDANTKAAACKAVSEWEAMKGKAKVKEAMELAVMEAAYADDDPALIAEAARYEADAELRAKLILEASGAAAAEDAKDGGKDDASEDASGIKVKCPKCGAKAVPKDGKCPNGHDVSKVLAFAKRLKSKTQEAEAEDPRTAELRRVMEAELL